MRKLIAALVAFEVARIAFRRYERHQLNLCAQLLATWPDVAARGDELRAANEGM